MDHQWVYESIPRNQNNINILIRHSLLLDEGPGAAADGEEAGSEVDGTFAGEDILPANRSNIIGDPSRVQLHSLLMST